MIHVKRLMAVFLSYAAMLTVSAFAQFEPPSPLQLRPLTHECIWKLATCNSTFSGQTTPFTCVTANGHYYDKYSMHLAAGMRVTITASSAQITPGVALYDQNGDFLLANPGSVTYTATIPGPYYFTVGSVNVASIGSYSVVVSCVTPGAGCSNTPISLCLAQNRFRVEVNWRVNRDPWQGPDLNQPSSGSGMAVPLTADTGYFWFFNAANVELVVKVLDARVINGKFWVFYGALSDVEYTILVTDTQTGRSKTYFNPAKRMASVADVEAF